MKSQSFALQGGWYLAFIVDDYNHLNIYISNDDERHIYSIESVQGDGESGNQLAFRFTTDFTEK